jgi:hypothetical protein
MDGDRFKRVYLKNCEKQPCRSKKLALFKYAVIELKSIEELKTQLVSFLIKRYLERRRSYV